MYCSKCGTYVNDTDRVCYRCGAALNYAQQNPAEAQPFPYQQADNAQPPFADAQSAGAQQNSAEAQPFPYQQADNAQPPYNNQPYGQQGYYSQPASPYNTPASGKTNVGMLVWSIISTVLCCLPLGIVSIIMTATASSAASLFEEQKKLRTAKILNIINNVVMGILTIIIIIIYSAVIIEMIDGGYYGYYY